jgi:hypothetical protein
MYKKMSLFSKCTRLSFGAVNLYSAGVVTHDRRCSFSNFYSYMQLLFLSNKLPPYTLEGFDLTAHMIPTRDDTMYKTTPPGPTYNFM